METDNKGESPRRGRFNTPPRKMRIGQDVATEKVKLLEYMFDTLCSVRMTAKSYDYSFLSYLLEMSALEVQKEIKLEKFGKEQAPEILDERDAAPNMHFKAGR